MSSSSPRVAFDEGLTAGELRYQRCRDCAGVVFYPRVLCPGCGGTALEWQCSEGLGTVYSATTVAQRDQDDYNVCLVDLDEGFRMMSTLVGDIGTVAIGERVRVRFADLAGRRVPVFAPERC